VILPLQWGQDPAWLWLIVPCVVIVLLDQALGWHGVPLSRRMLASFTRASILALLVVAVASPRGIQQDTTSHTVFVVDRSASLSDRALERAHARVDALRDTLPPGAKSGLVVFAETPEVAVLPGEPWAWPTPLRTANTKGSDLEGALELARALIPGKGEIVLLSDGHATGSGPPFSMAPGIPIHTIALDPERQRPGIDALSVKPGEAPPGSTLSGSVRIGGGDDALDGIVLVSIDGREVARKPVQVLPAEIVDVDFSYSLDERATPGPRIATATLIPNDRGRPIDNDQAQAVIVVTEPPRVRIYAGEPADGGSLAAVLEAEAMRVELVEIEHLQPSQEDLRGLDLVILANAPTASTSGEGALGERLLEDLVRFVDGGGGLIVLGGPQAFDMGSYGTSPLHRLLPVTVDTTDVELDASATILMVLDRSGSMAAAAGRQRTKMTLANEGAAASIDLLRSVDHVGVMSVAETVQWEVPLQPVRNGASLRHQVMRTHAEGGGIYVYTALLEAERALADSPTPIKHIILFCDASDAEEKVRGIPFGGGPGPTAEDLVERMRRRHITMSVIGIGEEHDPDTSFLRQLAAIGGGRFHLTDDARTLRTLFLRETERIIDSTLREVEFRPASLRRHAITQGIDFTTGPTLGGYQALSARPVAQVLVRAPEPHPLMTVWRYGLGQVIAWSSDAGPRWAARWLRWDGYARLWTQAARFAMRAPGSRESALQVETMRGSSRIAFTHRDVHGMSLDGPVPIARVRTQGQESLLVPLQVTEPGSWSGTLPTEPGRSYSVEVLDDRGVKLASRIFAVPLPSEVRYDRADRARLADLSRRSGGTIDPVALDPTAETEVTTHVVGLWPLAVLFALLLMPIDAWLRRPGRKV